MSDAFQDAAVPPRRAFMRWARAPRQRGGGLRRVVEACARLALVLAIGAAVLWWGEAMTAVATLGDAKFGLKEVEIALPRSGSVVIGRDALMQPSGAIHAVDRHIQLQRDADGRVLIANVATDRKLELDFARGPTPFESLFGLSPSPALASANRLAIPRGDEVTRATIGAAELEFSHVTATGVDIAVRDGGERRFRFAYAGGRQAVWEIRSDGDVPLGSCDNVEPSVAQAAIETLAALMKRAAAWFVAPAESAALRVGGRERSCRSVEGPELSAPSLPVGALTLTYNPHAGQFALADGDAGAAVRLAFHPSPRAPRTSVAPPTGANSLWLVDGADARSPQTVRGFIAGRTHYALELRGDPSDDIRTVVLKPLSKIPLFSASDCGAFLDKRAAPSSDAKPNCPGHSDAVKATTLFGPSHLLDVQLGAPLARNLSMPERALRLFMIALAVAIGMIFARPRALDPRFGQRRRLPKYAMTVAPLALSAALALWPDVMPAQSAGAAMAPTLANWLLAGVCLARAQRGGALLALFWLIVIGLVALGSISMATLCAKGPTTHWSSYIVKHKLLFIDLLPPFAIAAVIAPFSALRPALADFIFGDHPGYRLLRWAPALGLTFALLLWSIAGNSQGVGGFQPVEAGKFATAIMVGALLVQWRRDQTSGRPGFRWNRMFLLVVVVFAGLLLFVPILRSDYSPLIVIAATVVTLVCVRVAPDALQTLRRHWLAVAAFARVPLRLSQSARARRRLRDAAKLGLGLAAGAAALAGLIVFHWPVLAILLKLKVASWPDTREAQLALLHESLGSGRLVPIQRVIAWIDLDYANKLRSLEYRDLSFQVHQSRRAVAEAHCELSAPLSPLRMGRAAEKAAAVFGLDLAEDKETCRTLAHQNEPLNPIDIPVVQNDFAPAFFVAEHGMAAGALLIAAQIAFITIAVFAYARLRRATQGDGGVMLTRYLLSILLAGSTTLFVTQWFLSWSNMLGLLPVVGQPMTLLSSGTSHHLFMALPAIIVMMIGMRYTYNDASRRNFRAPPRPDAGVRLIFRRGHDRS